MRVLSKNIKDAILINYWFGYNYGAALVAYALQEALKSHNINTSIVNYIPKKFSKLYPGSFSEKFGLSHLNLTVKFDKISELSQLNKLTDTFITGSDQILNYNIYNTHGGNAYQLNFADNSKNLIACAASIGYPYFIGPKSQHIIMKALLERFNSISVREKEAQIALNKQFNIKTEIICDPVFSLPAEKWLDFCFDKITDDYIACYLLAGGYTDNKFIETENIISEATRKFGFNPLRLEFKKQYTCQEWMNYIANSKAVITDSCHGVYFSILFNKPLIIVKTNYEKFSRINNVLNLFDYKALIIDMGNFNESIKNLEFRINDYGSVNSKIELERNRFNKWIIESLQKTPNTNKINNDSIRNISIMLDIEKEQLLEKNENIKNLIMADERYLKMLTYK